jgi:predicted nucleic acid-binding protein
MKAYFADTSFWLVLELNDDQNHERALKYWQSLIKTTFAIVTTSYVFDEVVTYLNSRNHHEKAIEVGENLLLSPTIELVHVNENLFFEGWTMFRQRQDKRYSLTDCVSFVVMRQKELEISLTFDRHFSQAGFRIEP